MENTGNPFFQAIGQASENKRIEELKAELEGLGFKVSQIKGKKNSTATIERESVHTSMKEGDLRRLGIMGTKKNYVSKLGETVSFDGKEWVSKIGNFETLNQMKEEAVRKPNGYIPGATLCQVFKFLGENSTPAPSAPETIEGDSVEGDSDVEVYTAQDLGLKIEGDATVEGDSSPAPIEEDPYVAEFYSAIEKVSPPARKKSVLNKKK